MRSRTLAVVLPVAALALAACRGSENPVAGGPAARPPVEASPSGGSQSKASCPASSGLSGNVSDHGTKPVGDASIAIEAGDFFFAPTCTTGAPPGEVALMVSNTGQALHNVSFADQGIDRDVEPGGAITVTVRMGAGPLRFSCKYHRTSGMVGVLLPAGGS